jgi:hypothetical protein
MERNEPQQNDADLRALFQSKFENKFYKLVNVKKME